MATDSLERLEDPGDRLVLYRPVDRRARDVGDDEGKTELAARAAFSVADEVDVDEPGGCLRSEGSPLTGPAGPLQGVTSVRLGPGPS